jgi:hypothetical protein
VNAGLMQCNVGTTQQYCSCSRQWTRRRRTKSGSKGSVQPNTPLAGVSVDVDGVLGLRFRFLRRLLRASSVIKETLISVEAGAWG